MLKKMTREQKTDFALHEATDAETMARWKTKIYRQNGNGYDPHEAKYAKRQIAFWESLRDEWFAIALLASEGKAIAARVQNAFGRMESHYESDKY